MEREEFFRMKKIQAKKKRDRAQAEEEEASIAAPEDGQVRSMLDNDDDLPVLFT